MAIQGTPIIRVFKYNGITMADPASEKTPDQVKAFFAPMYPELLNSVIEGPSTKNGTSTYTFTRAVGSKGLSNLAAMKQIVHGARKLESNNPLANASLTEIKEAQKCSTVIQTVVNSGEKSMQLKACPTAYSRFG